jgi:PRTRC genetic system ThiF family protein
MIYEHRTHPKLLSERVQIALAGAGGNGSQMLSGLARLDAAIRALGHPGLDVCVYDPDTVSEANLGRQLFAPADVGESKAAVLVTRVNAWFGLRWEARPQRFATSNRMPGDVDEIRILITCVDSARARCEIGAAIARWHTRPLYWLDLGNRAADGQVVLGIPAWNDEHEAYTFRLPTVIELFPELADRQASLDEANAPSCSLAQALERQHLFVNQAVVTPALQLLWQIFRFGRTSWCGAFVNLESGRTTPLAVDPEAWARFGHHAGPFGTTVYHGKAKDGSLLAEIRTQLTPAQLLERERLRREAAEDEGEDLVDEEEEAMA